MNPTNNIGVRHPLNYDCWLLCGNRDMFRGLPEENMMIGIPMIEVLDESGDSHWLDLDLTLIGQLEQDERTDRATLERLKRFMGSPPIILAASEDLQSILSIHKKGAILKAPPFNKGE